MKPQSEPRLIFTAPQRLVKHSEEPGSKDLLLKQIAQLFREATPEQRAEFEQWLVNLAQSTRKK